MIGLVLALAAAVPQASAVTPMAERVAGFAALNKRSGVTRNFALKPGEQVRFDGLTIRVRACETAPPEDAKLTAAFLQIDEAVRGGARRRFSGWMYAESPSLHPFEHPLYDVWVSSCTMRFPATGPDTLAAGRPSKPSSSAKKLPAAESAPSN